MTPSRSLFSPRRLPVLVAAVCLAFGALAASALAGYVSVGTFANTGSGNGGSGTGQGELLNPGKAILHQATGNLYVADTGNDRVQVFAPDGDSGTFLTEFGAGTLDGPFGLAIDQDTGDVYVSDTENTRIIKYESDGQPTPSFTEAPGFTSPAAGGALAFDQAADELLVADPLGDLVKRFDTTGVAVGLPFDGTGSSAGSFKGILDIAVDSTGDILVVDSSRDPLSDVDWNTGQPTGSGSRVERFDSTGQWEATIGPVDGAGAIAVDPDDDRVIVAGRFHAWNSGQLPHYYLFAADGSPVMDFDLSAGAAVTAGLAPVGGGSSRLYAVTKDPYGEPWGPTAVHVLDDLPAPTATIGATTDITASDATAHGTVNPNGIETSYEFQHTTNGTDWSPFGQGSAGDGTSDVAVSGSAGGLAPNTQYEVRLVATSPAGTTTSGTTDTFTTDAVAPDLVTNLAATKLTTTSARLVGKVNPRNSTTTYHFEYGTDTSYGQSAPATQDGAVADGNQPNAVFEDIDGLQPDTTYHYRLIATNQAGTTTGPDRTLTTTAPTQAQSCPNAKFRTGPSAHLPDCLAYEKVTPNDKNGGFAYRHGGTVQAATDGNKVAWVAPASFAGGGAAPVISDYLSHRTDDGWLTRNIVKPAASDVMGSSQDISFGYRWFASDLSWGLFMRNDGPGIARNLYRQDFATNTTTRLSPEPLAPLDPVSQLRAAFGVAGVTGDGSHVLFESQQQLTADAPAPNGAAHLYQSVDGEVEFVGVMPDGSAAPASWAGRGASGGNVAQHRSKGTLSEDGSRIFFTVPEDPFGGGNFPDGEVYMRRDGQTTHISASQRTDCADDPTCGGDGNPDPDPDANGINRARFAGAAEDGSAVFVASCRSLTDDARGDCDGSDGGSREELYRYDTTTGQLDNVSATIDSGIDRALVVDVSDDGDIAYFTAWLPGSSELYMWRDGGVTHIGDATTLEAVVNDGNSVYVSRSSRMSPDGRYLTWVSRKPLAGLDTGGWLTMYLYDSESGVISCVSCPPDGGSPTSDAFVTGGGGIVNTVRQFEPQAIDVARRWVLFSTRDSLVPEDGNDVEDVYRYDMDSGEQHLLSGGGEDGNATFVEMSADGTVFIATEQQLTAGDRDSQRDLYAVREGGGLPEPALAPEPCSGDACQGEVDDVPDESGPASGQLEGHGDVSRGPRASLRLGRIGRVQLARLIDGRTAQLSVRVNRVGVVRVVGTTRFGSRSRVVARGSARARRAGRVGVRVRLAPAARERLADGGRLRVRLSVRFVGASVNRTLTLDRGRTR